MARYDSARFSFPRCRLKGSIMNRHQLTYIDLHPQPLEREPSPFAIVAGAAFALVALWVITVCLFSL